MILQKIDGLELVSFGEYLSNSDATSPRAIFVACCSARLNSLALHLLLDLSGYRGFI